MESEKSMSGPRQQAHEERVPYLTSREDWQRESYGRTLAGPESDFPELLERHLPKRDDWSVLEIGACPGSQLLAVALSHGYRPVALDYLPAVRQMPAAFARFGVPGLEVIEEDFLSFETPRRFNVVMSFGFVEHFAEPEAVIRRQWDLVAEGGYLVLGSPAFGGLQLALRRLVLKPGPLAATLRTHNVKIMSAEAMARVLGRFPGAEIVCAASAGRMGTWLSPRDKDVRRGRVWILGLWRVLGLIPKWLNWSSPRFSPMCLVIARKSRDQSAGGVVSTRAIPADRAARRK